MALTLIDVREGPCEICGAHKPGHCDSCGEPIPVMENMHGAGYQSPRPDHEHLRAIEGKGGKEGVYRELCLACYRVAWKAAYKGPCPV